LQNLISSLRASQFISLEMRTSKKLRQICLAFQLKKFNKMTNLSKFYYDVQKVGTI
jgi:hypothetical protein